MKLAGRFLVGAALGCAFSASIHAQQTVPGKAYVAEIDGAVTFTLSGKITGLKKGESVVAQGMAIETGPGASTILVYSNGTSLFVDAQTIVEIRKFVQQPFPSGVDTAVIEPSVSDTIVHVKQGRVIITTNQLAAGTTMVYLTPQSQVNIRGKEVVIEVHDQITRVLMLAGDATVTPSNAAPGSVGQTVHGGQMAIVQIQVMPLDQDAANKVATQVAAAERAQKVVVFGTTDAGGAPDIQARAVVPVNLPVPLTVSPSTLSTGG